MTSRAIRELYDHRLASLNITLTEATVLAFVAERGPIAQIRVAEAMGMGRSSAGKRVARLTQLGWCARRPDAVDARAMLVFATRKGHRVLGKIEAIDRDVRTLLRTGLSRDERSLVVAALGQIRANARAGLTSDMAGIADPGALRRTNAG